MASDSRLARYRDVATIGMGGMASVVLAEDTLLDRRVALKRMHPTAADRRGILRLRREALVGASMSHPNLVSIYDVIDSEDGAAVLVMEYVEGETLRDALTRQGRLTPREAVRVLRGIAGGLDAIHSRGIVHRDVKPANVLLGVDGRVKLADLGIASVPDSTRITTAGTVLGSFRYMAPEQLKDGPATRAIDIYALAAVAFELLCGRQARRESNPLAVAHAIATQPPPDLREIWLAAPPDAAEVLMHGMCRDPAGRPASAGEFVARLAAALEPEHTAPLRAPVAPRSKRPTAARALAPAAVEAAAGGARSSGGSGRAADASAGASAARRAGTAARPSPSNRAGAGTPATPLSAAGPRKTFTARAPWVRLLAPLALALVAGSVVVALLSGGRPSSTRSRLPSATRTEAHQPTTRSAGGTGSSGGSTSGSPPAQGASPSTASGTPPTATNASGRSRNSTSAGLTTGTAAAPSTSSGSSGGQVVSPAPTTPVAAVESFYQLAAAHRYAEAWALADETFRRQLGGFESFKAGQAADRAIIFDSAALVRESGGTATVYVRTTSMRTGGTEHCVGSVQLVSNASARWLVHLININCT